MEGQKTQQPQQQQPDSAKENKGKFQKKPEDEEKSRFAAVGQPATGNNRPKQQQPHSHHHQNRTFYNHRQFSHPTNAPRNGQSIWASSAKDKRHEFADKRVRSQTHQYQSNESATNKSSFQGHGGGEKSGRFGQTKARSLSTTAAAQHEHDGGVVANADNRPSGRNKQRNRKSTTDVRPTSNNSVSNGESIDYDELELDEPFSESEDEYAAARKRAIHQKPCLAIPRGRIRSLSGTIPPVGYSPHWGGPTMCLSCLQFFQLPEMVDEFSAHLLAEHKIVIDGIDIIVDLKRYVEHWRQQFTKRSVDQVFPKVVPEEGDPMHGKVDYYFNMSEAVKEDYALRQRLAMRRLEEALACQQREREDFTFSMQCVFCRYTARGNRAKIVHHLYSIHHLNLGSPDNLVFVQALACQQREREDFTFSMQCVFCRYTARGNRAKIVHHLYSIHHLNLGSPDNLVFVTEYIEHLREKIQRNECIYCEKTYSDRNTLMEHMRKKNHKEVNPKNNYYDKFYIINYLELGKRWLDVLAEDFEDTGYFFPDSDEEEEEESWHEWQEDNTGEEDVLAVCLFCDHGGESLDEITKHMEANHKFSLLQHIQEEKMGTYERMKFVNFIRKRKFNTRLEPAADTKFATIPERDEWDKEEHLVPMFGNDHLLWMLESHFLKDEEEDLDKPETKPADAGQAETVVELATLVEESKKNTVPGVLAEDLPDLSESVLADKELQESLR